MIFLLAAAAEPRPTEPVGDLALPTPLLRPDYRRSSRTSRFGFGFEVGGGGLVGPSIDLRLVGDLWLAFAAKPRLAIVGADDASTRINIIGTLAMTYPLFTARRWSFRAKLAGGGTIPLTNHFESVATLSPSVAFWNRRGMEISWSIGPGLYPYRIVDVHEASWQGFVYLDLAIRFHVDADEPALNTPVYTPAVPDPEPEQAPEPEPEGWGQVLNGSEDGKRSEPESTGPESTGSESTGPESTGPESTEDESTESESTGSEASEDESTENEPN